VEFVMKDSHRRHEVLRILLLLVLAYFLFFYEAGERYIWSGDEDEYALVNREMVEDGHWIYPTANGEPYSIKPPLFNWIGSLISVIHGEVTEATSCLPSAMAATVGIILLYLLGKAMFGSRAGLLASLVLATSPLYIEFARWIQIYTLSTMLLTMTLLFFYWGYTNERQRGLAYLLMYVPMGLGTLNMGPVNAVMPGIVIALYLIALKDCRHILKLRLAWGIVIYLLIVAPWHIAVSLRGGYAQDLLITTNVTRFFGSFPHARPFYYYVPTTPLYFLPWVLYLPGVILAYSSHVTHQEKKNLLFSLVWAVGLFVFFSLSKTKRTGYVLPIFPALALLVGFLIDRALLCWGESRFWKRSFIWPTFTFFALVTSVALGLPIYVWLRAPDWANTLVPFAVLVVLGVGISTVLIAKNRGYAGILTVVLFTAGGVAYGADAIVGKVNDVKSARSFCLTIKDRIPPGQKLKMFQYYRPVYAYYTHRFVENTGDPTTLQEWLSSNDRVYVVTTEKKYLGVKDAIALSIHIIHRQWVDHQYMVLLSNRPDEGSRDSRSLQGTGRRRNACPSNREVLSG
jgi:4-amino-4-deoxy-L-arabinose transferase-like glycosyltransferase